MTVNLCQMTDTMKKKQVKAYITEEESQIQVKEAAISYHVGYQPPVHSEMDMLQLIKKGIPKKALDKTMQMMSFTLDEMSSILHVSERTIRRYDNQSILNTEQSERIIELNNLYQFGQEVLGNLDNFKIWINLPILALGNQKPKEFLDTSMGIKMLTNILSRIEYGVYS